jgi:hypothetical protein
MALGVMYWATQMRLKAERETARAEQVAQDFRKAHAEEEQRRRALETAIDAIAKDLEVLRNVVGTASADTQLKQSVDQAENSIAQQVRSLTTSITRVAPRVYIHIVDESQRTAAEALERRIETMRIGSVAIVVPGIQKVGSGPPFSQLRCFAPMECQQNGPRLLQIINSELSEPTIRLQNFSSFGQSGDGKFRADHYELWFAPGPISLRQSGSIHSGTSG